MTDPLEAIVPGSPGFMHTSARCGLEECDSELYITFQRATPIYLLSTTAQLVAMNMSVSSSWEVGCEAGHKILLPPDTAQDSYTFGLCPHCYNEDVETCEYHQDDMVRLRAVIK